MNFNILTISTKPRTLLYAVLLSLLIFEITGHACGTSPTEEWNMLHKGINMDIIDSIQQTSDGGYIITGEKDFDLYVIKLEKAGSTPFSSFTYSPDDPCIDQQWISNSNEKNFYVAVGEMTASSGVHNFNLTSKNIPDGLFYNPITTGSFESLNFSINNECQILATSFVYTTSMYTSDDNISRISWLGQPYYVIDHNNKSMNITGFPVDECEDDTHFLYKKETLVLPEGFAITVPDISVYDQNVEILLTQYGEEKDKQIVNESEWYEYRSNTNWSGQNDNWIIRLNVEKIFHSMNGMFIKINSIQLISLNVVEIENSNKMNIIQEGYKTNIENDGMTLTVVRINDTENIPFSRDGTVSFMDNWFTVRVNSASDAVAVSSAVIISDTYELVGAVEYLYSGYADVNLTSKDNPAILYYDLENAQGHETLNFSIDNNYDPPYIDDPYRIPADSFMYTTEIYPTRDHNDFKIAWLGEPYMVIDHNSSTVVINKFLIDERSDDCYQLSIDNPLDLPYGFNPTASINDSNIACFSLIKDGLEVYNTTARAGDMFQYKEDLNSNGINDNLILSFTVESANKPIGSVMINSLWMISPESLMINDGDVDMLATYKINIKNAGSTIEVRIKENYYEYIHNDLILKEDKLTGILNNTFFIRVNGAVEVVKLLNTTDTLQYEHELIKRRVNSDMKIMPDIMKNGTNRTNETTPDVPVPGFGLFMCIVILLIVRTKLRTD